VRYGLEDLDQSGFTIDLSTYGIAIKTNQVFPPGTALLICVDIDGRLLLARGRVRWARQVPPQLINYSRCGMGIEFTSISERFKAFIQELDDKAAKQASSTG
jgi:hypothetical protein